MYDTVLFPTDGERSSERACEDAAELASLHDATLHVLRVVDEATVELLTEVGEESRDAVEESLEIEAEGDLRRAAEEAREALDEIETAVRHGKPEDEIVAYAEDVDADIIVMGTEERPNEYRDLLGSATENVLRTTSRRVMVVKTEREKPPGSTRSAE